MALPSRLIKLRVQSMDAQVLRFREFGVYFGDVLPRIVCYDDGNDVRLEDFTNDRLKGRALILRVAYNDENRTIRSFPATGTITIPPDSVAEMLNIPEGVIIP